MKKVLLSAAFALSLVGALAPTLLVTAESSSSSSSASSEAASSSSEETSSKKKSHSEADKANWGKRSTPVPLGQEKEVQYKDYIGGKKVDVTAKLTVLEVLKGKEAEAKLIEFESFNKEAIKKLDSKYELNLIKLKFVYEKGDEDEPLKTPYRPKVFDAKGKEVKVDFYADVPNEKKFSSIELYPGSDHEGYVIVAVPKGGDYSISYDFGKPVFFSTNKE